jgi:TolA-binding protein
MAKRKVKNSVDLRVISDEHPQFIARTARFISKYRDYIGYTLAGVAICGVLLFLMAYNNRVKNSEASALMQDALQQYERDLATSTISMMASDEDGEPVEGPELKVQSKSAGSFQSVYDNYPTTNSGKHALYMLGISHLNLGENNKALDAFNTFLENHPDHPLAPSALLCKSTALFNMGQTTESLDLLAGIDTRYPNFKLKDVLLYEQAVRYEALEQWTQAQNTYQTVIDTYPDSAFKMLSEAALAKLEKQQAEDSSETG